MRYPSRTLPLIAGSAILLMASASCAKKTAAVAPVAPPMTAQTVPAATPAPRTTQPAVRQAASTPTQRSQVMTPQERTQLNQSLARMEDALFDYDKATIRTDAMKALEADVTVIRGTLARYPQEVIRIEGHCDERGSAEYNQALGDRRAAAAKEFLVSMGVGGSQLTVISYGKEHPVCTDSTEACYQQNRRAHLVASN